MGRREGFSISHIRFKLKTKDAQCKSCIKFSDGNRECLISNLSPFQCLFICDEYCPTKVEAFNCKVCTLNNRFSLLLIDVESTLWTKEQLKGRI